MAHKSHDDAIQIPLQPSKFNKPHHPKDNKTMRQEHGDNNNSITTKGDETALDEENGRERLKRHRIEVAGRVWIPEIWGQEELLKDWIDCAVFDAPLAPSRILMARAALVRQGRRPTSPAFRIQNRQNWI
ncbi:hypothetical protein Fmac_027464 [Flemingia macrophylla]|uniref:Protein BIC1 n=1 Tax=Flemingia macrophylla TaxID=520843 RepID=A0ABD1LHS0_9FABA